MEVSQTGPILKIEAVTKRYGSVLALDEVSFQVERGSIFALLGPNGAGKSTLVKSITSLLHLNAGSILIDGIAHEQRRAREMIAYLPDRFQFYPYYTIQSAMEFFADLAGVPRKLHGEVIERALKLADIEGLRRRKVGTLSKGQNRRLGIASLFLSPADLVLLDEPFEGLDPVGFKDLKDLMRKLRDDGKTVFLNSHLLSDVQSLADHIALLHEGKIISQGATADILQDGSLEDFFYRAVGGKSGDKG